MSSTSPSGSPVDPHAAVGQTPTFPFVKHIPTVHEQIFKQFDAITSRINAAANALIFDKQVLPDFVRENKQWLVLCLPAEGERSPIVYLHWSYAGAKKDAHWKAYREYIDYLRNNVIQFEETVTVLGDFELRITRPTFRIDVQSPVPRQPNFTPPDVESTAPLPPK